MRKNRYKNKVLFIALFLVVFVGVNYVIFHTVTEDLITSAHFVGGDLARLGYLPRAKICRNVSVDLPRKHIPFDSYQGGTVDMITIGDSFSNGGGGGRNTYYQDYIASWNNLTVLNLRHYADVDFITTINMMLHNGFLDRLHPRYVLIGATERGAKMLIEEVDFNRRLSMSELTALKLYPHHQPPKLPFVNDGNWKYLANAAAYRYADHGFFGKVFVSKLERDFFSVERGNELVHFRYPIEFDAEGVKRLNDNMNRLADELRAKGIELIYMPYVDKYTLYAKWIANKKFPESPFFELLRPLPKRYRYVDTKEILREALERGEKDVFFSDDTHSSCKASEWIFTRVRFPDAPARAHDVPAGPVAVLANPKM